MTDTTDVWRGTLAHYEPVPWEWPKLSWLGLAVFGQMTSGALSGFEYVAILAGESKQAVRSIGQSVWISSPIICAMFILGTSSVVAYSQPGHIDFIAPIPQTLRIALGSSGIGNVQHLNGELLSELAGIRMVHVPYKGASGQLIDVTTGQVDMTFVSYAAADKAPEAKAALAEAIKLNPKLSVAWFDAHLPSFISSPPGFREALIKAGLPEE